MPNLQLKILVALVTRPHFARELVSLPEIHPCPETTLHYALDRLELRGEIRRTVTHPPRKQGRPPVYYEITEVGRRRYAAERQSAIALFSKR